MPETSGRTDPPVQDGPANQSASVPRGDQRRRSSRWALVLSFRNISGIYLFAVIFVVFSLWIPSTFLAGSTWKTLIDSQAETGMLAIGLVIALSAGAFDLAIGSELGLGTIVVAWLMINHSVATVPAIVLTILIGAFVGLLNGLLIVRAHIDSFIATLGMSSVLLAVIDWVSNSQQILGLSNGFQNIASDQLLGISLPVYIMLVLALVIWYVLELTPLGRQIYATGGNIEAARLAGVRVSVVIVGSLVATGAIAGLSGVVEASDLGTGDPTIGPAYLLPAITAAFLGSTQFRGGRFNVWGTLLAVYVLAAGVKGFQLAGAPVWIPDLFDGIALLAAVGLAKYQGTGGRTSAIRRTLRLRSRGPAEPSDEQSGPAAEHRDEPGQPGAL
jgi:ribose transport system permease protein